MYYRQNKDFGIILVISLAMHVFVLTVLFTIPSETTLDEGYKMVKVKLGIKEKKSPDITKIQKYNNYNNTPQQAMPAIPIPTIPEIKEEKPEISSRNLDIKNNDQTINPQPTEEKTKENATWQASKISKAINQSIQQPQTQNKDPENIEEEGIIIGNSRGKDAGNIVSYEQALPLWFEKFRKYPSNLDSGIGGVGEVFVKVDRHGKILLSKIIRSTGNVFLDKALTKMVTDADPVIPFPDDYYPNKKTLSYRIQFTFEPE